MSRIFSFCIICSFLFFLTLSCSNTGANPVESVNSDSSVPSEQDNADRQLLGLWRVNIDTVNLTAETEPERISETHYNVVGQIPSPTFSIKSYDPTTNMYDVDVTLNNNTSNNLYDVRLILFINDRAVRLINPDNWTPLYDIAGGYMINPYKAYAKTDSKHEFPHGSTRTERLQVNLPSGSIQILIAVDASLPSNCQEPYQIANFQKGKLSSETGAKARLKVEVYDWQSDVSSVKLYCPSITGTSLVDFTKKFSNYWELMLVNNTGAKPGNYLGVIIAYSSNSGSLALYEVVLITVYEGICPQYVASINGGGDFKVGEITGKGDYVFIASNFKVVDVSDPYASELVFESPASFGDLSFEGDHVCTPPGWWWCTPDPYVSCNGYDYGIADVSEPSNPDIVYTTWYTLPQNTFSYMELYQGNAYVFNGGIAKYNNPYSIPPGLSYNWYYNLNHGSVPNEFMIKGGQACIAQGGTFSSVSLAGSGIIHKSTGGECLDIDYSSGYTYIADGSGGLKIYSGNSALVNSITNIGSVYNVVVEDHYAYIKTYEEILVIDVSDVLNLKIAGNLEFYGATYQMFYHKGFLYLAMAGDSVIAVIDV